MSEGGGQAPAPDVRLADRLAPAAAAVAAAGWFGVLTGALDGSGWLALKGATVGLLALWAWARRRRIEGAALLAAALLAHAAGDVLLELAFLAGVGAFFVGHLVYLVLFWRRRLDLDDVQGGLKLILGALALLTAGALGYLQPRLRGELAVAVPLYTLALASMCGTAWLSRRGRPWVPLGATLFLVSDALLSLQLFADGIPGGRLAVWPLYVLGQILIAWGWLASRAARRTASAADEVRTEAT